MEAIAEVFVGLMMALAEAMVHLLILTAEILLTALLWAIRPFWSAEKQKQSISETRRKVMKRLLVVLLCTAGLAGVLWSWMPKDEDKPSTPLHLTPELEAKVRQFREILERKMEERRNTPP